MPRVSVVMSVRDGLPWLPIAVESVLGQTWRDLELLIVDDGSTDGSGAYLASLRDPRVRLLPPARVGLTASLNRAIGASTGPLVARMDADDVSAPERLERQVAFLDAHPDVGLLGTAATELATDGRPARTVRPPCEDAALRACLIRSNPFVHASVMLRRTALDRAGLYDERLAVAQDYDLWLRLGRVTRMANLPEPLVGRRLRPGQVSRAHDSARLLTEARCRWRAVARGDYPPWCLVFVLRPLAALALPPALRRRLRALLGARASVRAPVP